MVAAMALVPRRNLSMRLESFRLAVAGAAAGSSSRRRRATLTGLAIAAVTVAAVFAANSGASVDRTAATTLTGAGSTFVSPLVAQWTPAYDQATGVRVNYNPIGSGGGIAQIIARSVDFGASDAPLSPDQFRDCKGCVQIPWALSATAVMYKLNGVPSRLHLNGRALAGIYLGQIKKWNDPAIQRLNRGVRLPSTDITPIFRSDNSGTTYNFTDYLSRVSPAWKSRIGTGVNANWPAGVGGRGSSGVSGVLSRTEGGIAYADVAFALKNHFQYFAMQNRSGKYATPGLRGIQAAAASDIKPNATNELSIVNPPKGFKNAYPICTYTYIIVPTKTDKAPELRKFIFWALTSGQKYGPRLLFQPIPRRVLVVGERTLKRLHT
jgi:phosphate transport system substrate-binding protein